MDDAIIEECALKQAAKNGGFWGLIERHAGNGCASMKANRSGRPALRKILALYRAKGERSRKRGDIASLAFVALC
jgi:hypothetical protein